MIFYIFLLTIFQSVLKKIVGMTSESVQSNVFTTDFNVKVKVLLATGLLYNN